jgi:2-methylisocitrate lyase-like PEP mutase family enzyme
VFDGLSARIVEAAGFDAVYASGGAISRASGYPDLGLLTMPEILGRLGEIVRAAAIPVIADADTGYGNALNVYRTVREFEQAGAAALHLEDQVTPKRCGHYAGVEIIPADEMVQKLRAAVDARTDPDLVIIARTDARQAEGFEEAVRRANLYTDAGADVAFVEAPQSLEELEELPRRVRAPLLVNMFSGGKTPTVAAQELERLGYRIMIVPSELQRAAIYAMRETARVLHDEGATTALAARIAGFGERDDLVDLAGWQTMADRYRTP